MAQKSIAGEYQLQGAMEMASVFLLKPEGEFQFYLSYGALDRYGSGKWKLQNDKVVFNSADKPEHDFALLESKTVSGDDITVQITEKNRNLLPYVFASLQKENKESWQPSSGDGLVQFPKQEIREISLQFEFCSEKISTFAGVNKKHNYFSFRFEPWIAEVFFNDFDLKTGDDGLTGGHPLMKGNQFHYARLQALKSG